MDDHNAEATNALWEEAKSHIDNSDYERAIEIYKYILVRYDDNPLFVEYAHAYLGDVYLTIRRLDLAEKHVKKAISLDANKPHYYYLLGFSYSVGEQWKKAVIEFNKAIRLEPDNGEYERGLGWALFNAGDEAEGVSHLYRAMVLMPTNVNVLTDLGTAMLMLGNTVKAKEYGEKALSIEPECGLARGLLDTIQRIEGLK